VLGVAFQADLTAACAFPKHGNLHYPGAAYGGALVTVDIGLPREVPGAPPATARRFGDDDADGLLVPAARDAHKGTFGHVLLLAGGPGKGGAALLAARAALLGGAGLVTLGTDPACQARLEGLVPEVMVEAARAASVEPLLAGKRVVACGPGLGVSEETERLVLAVLSGHAGPVILDADALTVFAGRVERLRALHAATVLTPHPGEAARLLGISVADVQADRSGAVRELAARSGAVAVLKGACTVVAEPGGALTFVTTGNPGMGTGGSGDVLTGLVAATVSRHGLAADTVCAAVHVHGLAGDIASAALGERSVTAGSLCDHLPHAFARIQAHAGATPRRD
jgi:NAD(P)H-hydrate epimerase